MTQATATALFLEYWLLEIPPSSPAKTAQQLIRSWAELRDCLKTRNFHSHHLDSLKTLTNSQTTLHIAEPQAKLLLSILSSSGMAFPQSYPLIFRLLYIWVRKSSRPSSSLLESIISISGSHLVSCDEALISEGVLLLGAIIKVPVLSQRFINVCLNLFCDLFENRRKLIMSCKEKVPEILAGIGYALSSSSNIYFDRVFGFLLEMWNGNDGFCESVSDGLMLVRLMEYVIVGLMNSQQKIELICNRISDSCSSKYNPFTIVMISCGVLKGFNQIGSSNGVIISLGLRNLVEDSIIYVAEYLIKKVDALNSTNDMNARVILQCFSLGLTRTGSISFSSPVLSCLVLVLLLEIFPLRSLYKRAVEDLNWSSSAVGLNQIKEHTGSILYKEAGVITRAFCKQYESASKEDKVVVEDLVWNFCQEIYSTLRLAYLILRNTGQNELIQELDKIAEGAFLMVVVFSSAVMKTRVNAEPCLEFQSEIAVRILISFSFIEYIRRVRLPEYTDTVRNAVLSIQGSGSSSISFVESMPSYVEITKPPISCSGRDMYSWSEDDVQSARILFYLRVIPTCIEHIPNDLFIKMVAPAMFLYMHHPNEKVSQASHSVFSSFISSGEDSNQDDESTLKEKLAFYYVERALQAYPGVTSFEGLASGIIALVQHLPAGSPAIFYCIDCLFAKAMSLCSNAVIRDINIAKDWQPDLKLLKLLLRLISLVDVQVCPTFLKQLARLVLQFPKDGRNVIFNEMYSQVAESDDVTRKPILVSWLQSLSYLCSEKLTTKSDVCVSEKPGKDFDMLDSKKSIVQQTISRL